MPIWSKKKNGVKLQPEIDPTSLGNILIEMGAITHEHLKKMVDEFEDSKKREYFLGKFLVQQNVITPIQLEIALLRQQIRRGNINSKSVINAMHMASDTQDKINFGLDKLAMVAKGRSHGW